MADTGQFMFGLADKGLENADLATKSLFGMRTACCGNRSLEHTVSTAMG